MNASPAVRNRSKELVELLGDVEKIRAERRKAKNNKNKYTGTGNDAFSFSSGGSRYGGFGSDSPGYGGSSGGYGGSSSGNYGGDYSTRGEFRTVLAITECAELFSDYDSYSGGGGSGGFRDSSSRKTFEEYDAGDDDVVASRRSNSISASGSTHAPRRSNTAPVAPTPTAAAKAKAPEPALDLLGLDDDFAAQAAAPIPANNANKALPTVAPALDRTFVPTHAARMIR